MTSSNAAFSNIVVRNCGNSEVLGGAISASFSTLNITNCTFAGNRASSGGAVALTSGYLTVSSSVFIDNSATCNSTNCSSAWGGALVAHNAEAVFVTDSQFVSNSVFLSSGAALAIGVLSAGTFAAGGGCIAVTYNQSSQASRVFISGNAFLRCSARIATAPKATVSQVSGFFSGAFGGAVAVYHGLNLFDMPSVIVTGASAEFINNNCSSSSASIAVTDDSTAHTVSAQGGCLSIFIGSFGRHPGDVKISNSVYIASRNIISGCSAVALSKTGSMSFGGGISISFGSVDTNACVECRAGLLDVQNSRVVTSINTVTDCIAAATVEILRRDTNYFVFGPSSAGAGISVFVANTFIYQTVSSTSDIMGDASITKSIVISDGNIVRSCRAQSLLSGQPEVPALASFTFGGGISVLLGAIAFSSGFSTLNMQNVTFSGSITANSNTVDNCTATLVVASQDLLPFDPLAFGGGISLFVGSHIFANVQPKLSFVNFVGNMEARANSISRCEATLNFAVYGSTVSGGGISMHVGGHTQFLIYNIASKFTTLVARAPISFIGPGSTIVCESNVVSNCSASSSSRTSNGGVVRGGGISIMIGGAAVVVSFGYKFLVQAVVAGSTPANMKAYQVSATKNDISNCFLTMNSSVSSSGAILSGGGINVMIGASCFSFSAVGLSACSAGDMQFVGNVNISANSISHCNALVNANVYSTGSMLLGGCVSATIGASIVANGQISSGSTTFTASLSISQNNLTHCFLDSNTNGEDQASSAFGGECCSWFDITSYSHQNSHVNL